jgi:membrane-associated phospholipid phosphatase
VDAGAGMVIVDGVVSPTEHTATLPLFIIYPIYVVIVGTTTVNLTVMPVTNIEAYLIISNFAYSSGHTAFSAANLTF